MGGCDPVIICQLAHFERPVHAPRSLAGAQTCAYDSVQVADVPKKRIWCLYVSYVGCIVPDTWYLV